MPLIRKKKYEELVYNNLYADVSLRKCKNEILYLVRRRRFHLRFQRIFACYYVLLQFEMPPLVEINQNLRNFDFKINILRKH